MAQPDSPAPLREFPDRALDHRVEFDCRVEPGGPAARAAGVAGAAGSAEADEAARWHEHFMAVVSHDLRGPLSAIMTSATLLQHKLAKLPLEPGTDERPGTRQIEAILRAVKQLDRRIGELLDVSLLQAGRLKLELERHDIGALLRESVELTAPAASKHGLRLIADIPERALVVSCDRKRVLQALSQLLDNAVKFTPEGGSVVARAHAEPGQARISIENSGVGMAPDEDAHLFDPVQRARNAARHGIDLGLALARGIIEAHGGHLSAASAAGKGSAFSLTLPMESPVPGPMRSASDHV